jgi:hypothetical protein
MGIDVSKSTLFIPALYRVNKKIALLYGGAGRDVI